MTTPDDTEAIYDQEGDYEPRHGASLHVKISTGLDPSPPLIASIVPWPDRPRRGWSRREPGAGPWHDRSQTCREGTRPSQFQPLVDG